MQKRPEYFIDQESVNEMARLEQQADLITQQVGLLPPMVAIPPQGKVLDIACGPGEWPQRVALSYPTSQVIGIDKSQRMIKYARSRTHGQTNIQFQMRDACQPLPYADATFAVIHARFLVGFMTRQTWPDLLQECFRLTAPQGVLLWTESETLIGTSPGIQEYSMLVVNAMYQAGHAWTNHQTTMGLVVAQESLLRQAGFVRTEAHLYGINFSWGTALHASFTADLEQAFRLLLPFVIRQNGIAEDQVIRLVEQCAQEMQDPSFQALSCCQRVCAYR